MECFGNSRLGPVHSLEEEEVMKPGSLTAMILLSLVAVAHLLRVLFRVEVTVGGMSVPIWPSGIAGLVAAGIAGMLWREGRAS